MAYVNRAITRINGGTRDWSGRGLEDAGDPPGQEVRRSMEQWRDEWLGPIPGRTTIPADRLCVQPTPGDDKHWSLFLPPLRHRGCGRGIPWSRTLVSNSPVSGSRLEPANGLCARGGRLNSSAGLGDPGWLGKLTDGGVGVAAPPGYAAGVGVNGRSGGRGKCRLRKDAICFACGPPRGNRSSHRSRVARKRTGPDSSWNPAPFFLSVVT